MGYFFLRAILFTAAGAAFAQTQPMVIDRVAVVVGNRVITETEVDQEARLEEFLNQAPLDLSAEARRAAAEHLVDQQLVRNEMRVGAYPAPTDQEVEQALKEFRDNTFSSAAHYQASLQKYGISEDQLARYLRWQLAALRFTDLRFSPAVPGIPGQQDANRAAGTAALSHSGDVDQQLDAWLKQQRSDTRIRFKEGAFQ